MLNERSRGPRRRWALAGPLFVALLALAVLPAAANAQPGSEFFGVNIQPLTQLSLVPDSQWNGYIQTMSNAGLNVARSDAEWAWVEPNAPSSPGADLPYDAGAWNGQDAYASDPSDPDPLHESMDNLVGTLAMNGVRYIPVLDSPPAWAGNPPTVLMYSQYIQDYANFAGAFAARYGRNGTFWSENPTIPYLPVEQYEVWDEGNSTDFWSGASCGGVMASGTDPTLIAECPDEYATGLSLASTAIHAADPSATVLASIGWQNFRYYLPDLYQALASDNAPPDTINGIGMHPYGVDAVAILQLDETLRETLNSVAADSTTSSYAAAGLPIYDTEDGQPVVSSGPGADYTWANPAGTSGYVTDAARAAMVSLVGDALARSDCDVEDYVLYGLVGSGITYADGGEPNDEGLMGLWSLNGDLPDLTADAFAGSAVRWAADPSSGIVLCGAGTTPTADLLPLAIQATSTSPTCVSATITYDGNPIEGANLVLQDGDDTVSTSWPYTASNAHGEASVCLDANAPPVTSLSAYAELSTDPDDTTSYNVAISPTWTCVESGGSCTPPAPAAPTMLTPSTVSSTSTVQTLTYLLHARIVRVNKHGTTLRARLELIGGDTPASDRLTVWLRRHGKHAKLVFLAHKTLSTTRALTFRLAARLRRGQRVVLKVAADPAFGIPALESTLKRR